MATKFILPASTDDPIARGDTIKFDVAITRSGNAVDLTGATFKVTGRHTPDESSDLTAIFQKTIGSGVTVTSAAGGTIRVQLDPADTANLSVSLSTYEKIIYVDVQMVESDGTVSTVARGTLTIVSDITRTN